MATTGLINSGLYPHARDTNQFVRISRAIQANLDLFKGKNVLSVRPGYKVVDGWPTRKPAIVAVVETKTDAVEKADILPAKVDGFAVDVRQASSAEKLRVQNPRRYAQLNASAPREFALPEFADEISPESKQALMSAVPPLIEEARATKPEIDYSVPSGVTLDLIDEPMSIVCHAGPDAAWQQLARFLSEVQSTLTVGMYDFTSAHVLNAVEQAMQHAGGEFTLTLDHPAKNKSADQSDEETVADLGTNLPATFQSAWALVRSSRMASKWIYPTAYHIKVAVRDSASNDPAMWLSSGNWNNSNQADISVDPADLRDWSEQAKKFDPTSAYLLTSPRPPMFHEIGQKLNLNRRCFAKERPWN